MYMIIYIYIYMYMHIYIYIHIYKCMLGDAPTSCLTVENCSPVDSPFPSFTKGYDLGMSFSRVQSCSFDNLAPSDAHECQTNPVEANISQPRQRNLAKTNLATQRARPSPAGEGSARLGLGQARPARVRRDWFWLNPPRPSLLGASTGVPGGPGGPPNL